MGVSGNELDRRIQEVRRFNRAYTRLIGLLDEGLLNSPFSLTQARVLFELAQRERPAASDLSKEIWVGSFIGMGCFTLRNMGGMRSLRPW
jgi:hypothetical protein